ncbi:MAG: hypothetical protein WCV84_04705 [Patescibacteria group bacterium]
MSYPRKTVAAIVGTALAGIATVVITVATIATLNVTNLTSVNTTSTRAVIGTLTVTSTATMPGALTNSYSLFTTGNLLATSTFSAQAANVTTTLAVGGASTMTGAVAANGGLTFTQATGTTSFTIPAAGSPLKGLYRTTSAIDVQSMAIGSVTSSAVALTGSVGDHCTAEAISGDYRSPTSTGLVQCKMTGTNTATLYFSNVSSTAAFDAGMSTFSLLNFVF